MKSCNCRRPSARKLVIICVVLAIGSITLDYMYLVLTSDCRLSFKDVLFITGFQQAAFDTRNYTNVTTQATPIYNRYGFVTTQFLNLGYLNLTKSWICNVECFGILPSTLFIVSDMETYQRLTSWKPELNVVLEIFGSPESMLFGEVDYYKYGLFRVRVINEILKGGMSVFETESDAVWFDNPTKYFQRYKNIDLIVMDNGCADMKPSGVINGGFIYLNATSETRYIWNELTGELHNIMHRYKTCNDKTDIGITGSEQMILGQILNKHPLHMQWLPIEHFVSGFWYMQEEVRLKTDPVVILNNYIRGNDNKESRAKQWSHWWLSNDGKCKACPPKLYNSVNI
ncbi:uncharacterized protein LOC144443328 [Glandiceps talaboti]